ncbi:MMPL family transporter [Corynebacterium sp. 335C]
MAKALFALGRWSYLNKWKVIIAWVIILAGLGGSAAAFQKGFSDQFAIPGAPSTQASELLDESFPGQPNPVNQMMVTVAFRAPEGEKLSDPANKEAVDRVVKAIEEDTGQLGSTLQLANPVDVEPEMTKAIVDASTSMGMPRDVAELDAKYLSVLSENGRIGTATFTFDIAAPADLEPQNRQAVLDAMQLGRDAGLEVEAMGPGFMDPVEITALSEIIGVVVAFIVLIVTFGSLIAAGMPLITAVIGVGVGALGVVLLTAFAELNTVTPVLAVMIGLAVGIDYALFIMARYRAELGTGISRPDAMGLATGTAGSSVVFAGATVLIALAALVVARIPFLSWMGVSAAATVAVAVIISLTLLPAIMALVGRKVFGAAIPGIAGNPLKGARRPLFRGKTMGRRWVELVHRVPGLFLAVVVIGLLALALPAKDLRLALPSDSTANLDTTQRQAVQIIEEGFGPGRNAQMVAVVNAEDVNPDSPLLAPLVQAMEGMDVDPGKAPAMASFVEVLDQLENNVDVAHVQIVGINEPGTAAQLMITPATGPLDERTSQMLTAVREQLDDISAATGVRTGVTGLVPIEMDVTQQLSDVMPMYLGIVVGLAIVLLLLVFRSIVVPLTAGLGFLLSVGAAFGVTVAVWQQGFGGFIDTPGPLVSFMPIFLIGVTFGLAMDYQVFLVSRMREHYTHSGGRKNPKSRFNAVEESIVEGFSHGARVVTAAALIMIIVFFAFMGQPLPFVKIFGFAMGVMVLFDAFLIRMTLIPASMFLLGRATWWLPRWLDRILPSVDVEGEGLGDRRRELVAEAREDERDARDDGAFVAVGPRDDMEAGEASRGDDGDLGAAAEPGPAAGEDPGRGVPPESAGGRDGRDSGPADGRDSGSGAAPRDNARDHDDRNRTRDGARHRGDRRRGPGSRGSR